jgi:hypothetical protein
MRPAPFGDQPAGLVQPESAQHDREAQHGRAAHRGERQEDAVGLPESDLAPREAPEGHTRAYRLARDPEGGRPHRPGRQPGHGGDTDAHQRDEDRLDGDEGQPGTGTDLHTGPHQQRQQEAQPEEVAEAEGRLPATAAQHPAESGEGGQRQPPQGARREADVEQHSAERGGDGRDQTEQAAAERAGRGGRLEPVRLVNGSCGDGHPGECTAAALAADSAVRGPEPAPRAMVLPGRCPPCPPARRCCAGRPVRPAGTAPPPPPSPRPPPTPTATFAASRAQTGHQPLR